MFNLLSREISHIGDIKLQNFATECLKKAPQYFWSIPASVSGLHHPAFARSEGGLVKHTKATIAVALDLITAYPHLLSVRDRIIVALLLHDTIKLGIPPKEKTDPNHPMYPREYYREQVAFLTQDEYDFIMSLIESHMGIWGSATKEQNHSSRLSANEFVHICDYIASRKWAENLYCEQPDEENALLHIYGQEA